MDTEIRIARVAGAFGIAAMILPLFGALKEAWLFLSIGVILLVIAEIKHALRRRKGL